MTKTITDNLFLNFLLESNRVIINSPLSKRVETWDEGGRAFNYGIVWGMCICFQLRVPPNDPITERAPTLAPGFYSF